MVVIYYDESEADSDTMIMIVINDGDGDDHIDPARGFNDWLSVHTQECVQIPEQYKIAEKFLKSW